jgi:predicted aspartyl protease
MTEIPYPWIGFGLTIGTWDVVDLAYPDTGFEGGLLIPVGVGREVLASPNRIPLRLADGNTVDVLSWRGIVEMEGRRFLVEVAAMGTLYLLGREVLDQMEVCFEFGRRVRVRFDDEPE